MRAVIMVGLALLSAGCDNIPKTWSETELRDLAQDEAEDIASAGDSDLESRISELEAQVAELQAAQH